MDLNGSKRFINISVYCSVTLFLLLFSVYFLTQIFRFPMISDDYGLGVTDGGFIDRVQNLYNQTYARGPFFFVFLLNIFFKIINDYHYAHVVIGTIHIMTCFGLVLLAKKLWNQINYLILLSMFLFMFINPLGNHSTMWILQSYPIFTLFFGVYASLALFMFEKNKTIKWLLCFIILSTLSILCNEQGLLMLPMYMAVVAYTRDEKFLKNLLDYKIQVPLILIWLIPYLSYRIYLYVFHDTTSAVSGYAKMYSTMFEVFPKLFAKLSESFPLSMYVIWISLCIIGLIYYKRVVKKELWMIVLLIPYMVLLLAPFSLLGGYITERFFYISGMFFVFTVFWMINISVNTLKNYRFVSTSVGVLLIFISLYYVKEYNQESLKPIGNMNYYVSHFIEERSKLPKDATILLDIVEPSYKLPRYWLATFAFRDKWSTVSMNTIYGGDIQLIEYSIPDKDTIKTSLRPGFLSIDEITKMENKKVYVYKYDGVNLYKINGKNIEFTDKDIVVKTLKLVE